MYMLPSQSTKDEQLLKIAEKIKSESKGKKYNCIKFSASLLSGTIFTSGENMKIWVTNDSFHIPVYIEADILVGSVKAFISSYNGNK